jgi:hypothetical protein
MKRLQRYIISAFVLMLISCAAVGYAAAGGLSEGVVSETSVDTVSATQSNGSDFPLAGDANGTVPIRVEMDGIETATVTYGRLGAGQNVRFDATIRDTDGDGTATVTFDPTSFGGSTASTKMDSPKSDSLTRRTMCPLRRARRHTTSLWRST